MVIYLGREEFDDGRILNVSGGCMFARLAMILGFVISNLPDFGEVSGQPLAAARLCFYAEICLSGPHCSQCPCCTLYLSILLMNCSPKSFVTAEASLWEYCRLLIWASQIAQLHHILHLILAHLTL